LWLKLSDSALALVLGLFRLLGFSPSADIVSRIVVVPDLEGQRAHQLGGKKALPVLGNLLSNIHLLYAFHHVHLAHRQDLLPFGVALVRSMYHGIEHADLGVVGHLLLEVFGLHFNYYNCSPREFNNPKFGRVLGFWDSVCYNTTQTEYHFFDYFNTKIIDY